MKPYLIAATILAAATPVYAADLGYVEAEIPAAYEAPSTWTGFYLGVFGGGARGDAGYYSDIDVTFPYLGNSRGGLLGVQAGANYQTNSFVFGGVIDIAATNIEAGASGGGITIQSDVNYMASLRAKAGYATDNLLVYVHGGGVLSETETSATLDATGNLFDGFHGDTRVGFTLGAGLEVKVADNVSLFTEYAYTDLGDSVVFTNPPAAVHFELEERIRFHSIKAGINFHF
jgi:outer membrane immunogenic protein